MEETIEVEMQMELEQQPSSRRNSVEVEETTLSNLFDAAQHALKLRRENDFSRLPLWIKRHITMKVRVGKIISEIPTDCYGSVEFRGVTRSSRGKFIRLSDNTDTKRVYNLMRNGWNMDQPRLLVSVIGGDKSFTLDANIKQHFTTGLSKIAQTPGAWIISGGTNAGVTRYVGDALQGCANACIGICPWGVITHKEALMRKTTNGKYSYHPGSWLTDTGTYLDYNHTHFLLVDNGKNAEFDTEVRFRHDLERYIMTKTGEKVPNVLLVMEGGFGTLARVYSSIVSESPTPIVIVKGSGGAADLFVYVMQFAKEIENEKTIGRYHQGLVANIYKTFPDFKGGVKLMKKCYMVILECLRFKHMFTISHSTATDGDISDSIFTALLNDISSNVYRQMVYTLEWRRADLAKTIVFEKKLNWQGDEKILQWVMIMALATDNVVYVQLLLEYGFNMISFLTNEVLEFLYGFRAHSHLSPLKWETTAKDFKPCNMTGENGEVYASLCEQRGVDPEYAAISRHAIEDVIDKMCDGLVKVGNEKFIEDLETRLEEQAKAESTECTSCITITFKYPFRELFFWAVLNNMKDMALFLWQFEEQPIAKALIAAEMSDVLYEGSKSIEELEKTLSEMSRIFKEQAVKVLDQCYKSDEVKTQQLITSFFYQFEGMSGLNLAVSSENQEFVSHGAVQGLLNDIWTGHMKSREVDLWQITLGVVFPWRIRKFEFKTVEEIKKTAKVDDDESEESDDDDDEWNVAPVKSPRGKQASRNRMEKQVTGTQLPFYKKIRYYYSSPVVKFVSHVIFYFLFLMNYSYFAMLDKYQEDHDHGLPLYELLLLVTVFAYFVAEMYQVIEADAPTLTARVVDWASSKINIVDAIIILAFFIGTGLRVWSKYEDGEYAKYGQLVYAVDCGLWILRVLHIFHINPTIGPYVIMIVKMVKDLATFMAFLAISLFAFGVTFAAILAPKDPHDPKFSVLMLIRDCIWQPYFKVYGLQFVNREQENNMTTRFNTERHNNADYEEAIVWILMGLYHLLTNLLLFNLLIAVFNNTYNEVQENSSQIWKYERYSLIKEYTMAHPLPPPFSLISHSVLFMKWIWYDVICGQKRESFAGFKTVVTEMEKTQLLEFECHCVTQISRQKKIETMSFEEGLAVFRDELEQIRVHITSMNDIVESKTLTANNKSNAGKSLQDIDGLKKTLGGRRSGSIMVRPT